MTYRVVQWATGAVGKTCLRAVLDHPDLSLAGVYVYSDRKAGRDAGAIARYPDTGIIATREIGEILALDADVVIHTARLQLPYTQHDSDICALLRSGKNVITTAGQHYPAAHGPARLAMFDEAARAGGVTLYGTGMNPGYVLERLVLGLTGVCTDVRRIEVVELLNAASMPDPDFVFTVMGMGSERPPWICRPARSQPCTASCTARPSPSPATGCRWRSMRSRRTTGSCRPSATWRSEPGTSRPGPSRPPSGGGTRYRPGSGS